MTRRMLALTVTLAALSLWLGTPLPAAAVPMSAAASPTSSAARPSAPAGVAGEWSWPLRGSPFVVQGFQPPPERWLAGHRGVDLLASPGQPVLAAGAGRVSYAGWVGGVPVVAVTHPDGRRTTYQPVLATVVRGQTVVRGAILGRVSAGGSHCLPRACLHWGLRTDRSYLDPLSLVGAAVEVRLLPLWSAAPAGSSVATAGSMDASRAVMSLARAGALNRLGALNRARASPWEPWARW